MKIFRIVARSTAAKSEHVRGSIPVILEFSATATADMLVGEKSGISTNAFRPEHGG